MMKRYSSTMNGGFTLLEILISLTISTVLITGFVQILSTAKQNYRVHSNLSTIMDNGRYGLEFLGREIRRSGFKIDPITDADAILFGSWDGFDGSSATEDGDMETAEFIRGEGPSGSKFTDRVVLRYEVSTVNDLDGMLCTRDLSFFAGEQNILTLYLFVEVDADGIPVLYCQSQRESLATNDIDSQAKTALLSSVENLRILYGIDTDFDNTANQYLPAASVTDWTMVVSAHLSLVLQSKEKNLAMTSIDDYIVNGSNTINTLAPNDGRLYRVFESTITLRNQI